MKIFFWYGSGGLQITKRPAKTADPKTECTKLWDIRDVDNLDPIVKLMIESLSSEIFGLSGEMQDMEGRLLSKMAKELIPTAMATAMPAHAIIHATATVNETLVNSKTEFHYKNPAFMQKHSLKRLVFTPVVNTKLVNAKVDYFIADGDIFALNAKMMKDKVALPNEKLWSPTSCAL